MPDAKEIEYGQRLSPALLDVEMGRLSLALHRWRRDPVAYAIEACGFSPNHKQAEILYGLVRNKLVAIRSGRGVGKSRLLALAVHWFLDTMWEPGMSVKVPCTGPSGNNLGDILWSEVALIYNQKAEWLRNRFELNAERLYWKESPEECFAVIRTARRDNPEALRGFHGKTLYVIDECTGVPEEIFDGARAGMTEEDSYALLAGNPTRSSGFFWKIFNTGDYNDWFKMNVSCLDLIVGDHYEYERLDPKGNVETVNSRGMVTRKFVEGMKREYGDNSNAYKVEVLGEFGTGDDDLIIEPRWVERAWDDKKAPDGMRRVMGVDVARSGNDDSALAIRCGPVCEEIDNWHGADTVETEQRVVAKFKEFKAQGKPIDKICVDTIGIGAGVYDNLRHKGYPAFPINVAENAIEDGGPECYRLRDWLWWRGRMFFKSDEAVLAGDRHNDRWNKFARELETVTFHYHLGKVRVEEKDDLKKRGLASPNIADAFLMTLFFDHTAKVKRQDEDERRKKAKAQNKSRNWRTI